MPTDQLTTNTQPSDLSDNQISDVLKNVAPEHPALRRVHEKLNDSEGAEATISSYDRMHHRHSRA